MKLLLTFLTIALFSFGANAEYNKKFTAEKCQAIYDAMSDKLNTESMYYYVEFGLTEYGGNYINQQKNFIEQTINMIGGLSNAYQTFCKD